MIRHNDRERPYQTISGVPYNTSSDSHIGMQNDNLTPLSVNNTQTYYNFDSIHPPNIVVSPHAYNMDPKPESTHYAYKGFEPINTYQAEELFKPDGLDMYVTDAPLNWEATPPGSISAGSYHSSDNYSISQTSSYIPEYTPQPAKEWEDYESNNSSFYENPAVKGDPALDEQVSDKPQPTKEGKGIGIVIAAAVIGAAIGVGVHYATSAGHASGAHAVYDYYYDNQNIIEHEYRTNAMSTRPGERVAAQHNYEVNTLQNQESKDKGLSWAYFGAGVSTGHFQSDNDYTHVNWTDNNGYVFK